MALLRLSGMEETAISLNTALKEATPEGVISASVYVSFVYDRLEIGVVHTLATRSELERDGGRLVQARLRQILRLDNTAIVAKVGRIQRRQLTTRGIAARSAKPKKVR